MSFSSAKARPASRGAGNAILILVALLLAALSTAIPQAVRQQAPSTTVAAAPAPAAKKAIPAAARQPRGLFIAAADDAGRSYHPGFETSNSAGALGFWMLLSLCGILLAAALAPGLVRSLRSAERRS